MGLSKKYECKQVEKSDMVSSIRFAGKNAEVIFSALTADAKPFVAGKWYSVIVIDEKGREE